MKELKINGFNYSNKTFTIITIDFDLIHKGDIKIYNHKTDAYRIFKFKDSSNFVKTFVSDDNLTLKIIKHN